MLKILIKKQMKEIFRGYFYDTKTGRNRARGATIAFIVVFILLVGGLLGGIFTWLSNLLCGPFVAIDAGWLYFVFMSLMATFLGAFGSIFNTYASLYLAKDNDMLLSLPIPVHTIIAARLCTVYLMGLIYSCVVTVPASIVYCVTAGVTAKSVIGAVFTVFIVSVIVLMLSCVLGYLVAVIGRRLKSRSIVTVLISILFIGAYYLLCIKSRTIITELTQNAAFYEEKVRTSAYPLYMMGKAAEGNPAAILVVIAVTAALAAVIYICMSKSFIKTATASAALTKSKNKKIKTDLKTSGRALLAKEFGKFTSSSSYMLNCGLGILMLPLAGAVTVIKGGWVMDLLTSVFDETGFMMILFAAGVCMLSSMNDMAAASVSLEGRSLWIMQMLPVDTHKILMAKAAVQMILSGAASLICSLCIIVVVKPGVYEAAIFLLLVLIYTAASSLFGLVLNLKRPNLTWTSETAPVKQSMAVTVALFGGWLYTVITAGGFFLLRKYISADVYMTIITAVTAGLCIAMYCWLKSRGAKIFESL